MNTRGFALLAVLWVLTALTALSGVAVAIARTGFETTRNRVLLARAGWAREACVEILLARYAQDPAVRRLDTVDLGRGTWCHAELEDAGAKVNVNRASPTLLYAVARAFVPDTSAADSLAGAILERRRWGTLLDLGALHLALSLDSVLTSRGRATVDVNAVSPTLLRALPGITDEAASVLLERRMLGRPVANADELNALLSQNARAALLESYREFVAVVTFAPTGFVGTFEGGVRGAALTARATLTLAPATGRLAVIRRESE